MLGTHERTASAASSAAPSARQVVTRVFSNSTLNLIPGTGTSGPAANYPWPIAVSGFTNGVILDLNVTLDAFNVALDGFNHNFPDDVDILLAATHIPGRNAIIMSDVGGDANALGIELTLDDVAAAELPNDGPLGFGTFRPTNFVTGDTFDAPAPAPTGTSALSTFNGQNPNGTWQLFVMDDAGGDTGAIFGLKLEITAEVDA
jgi:hypothetical protein